MRQLRLLFIGVLCVLNATSAHAETRTGIRPSGRVIFVPFSSKDIVLTGRSASTTVPFELTPNDTRRGVPVAVISIAWSSLVNPQRSTLHVTVDGVAVHSSWLSQGKGTEKRRIEVPLGDLRAGAHMLRVRSRMRVDDDPCLQQYQDEAWVRIRATSGIRWTQSRTVQERSWSNFDAMWLERGGDVFVELQGTLREEELTAALELHRWLVARGLRPQYQNPPKNRLADITLTTSRGGFRHRARDALTAHPQAAMAVARHGSRLTVVGHHQDLAASVHAFFALNTRQHCQQRDLCLVSRAAHRPRHASERQSDRTMVLRLRDVGYDNGWTAQGSGRHELRLVWTRPEGWTVDRPPRIELPFRTSTSRQLDPERSSLSIRVNERPVATWDFQEVEQGSGTLQVYLPPAVWDDSALSVEVIATLQHRHPKRCEAEEKSALWLVLEGEGGLSVERVETIHRGVSTFGHSAPYRTITLANVDEIRPVDLPLVAEIIVPLLDSKERLDLAFVDEAAHCEDRCITFRQVSSPGKTVSALAGMPLVHEHTTPVLTHHSWLRGVHVLEVQLPLTAVQQPPPVPYRELVGPVAVLTNGRWMSSEDVGDPIEQRRVKRESLKQERSLEGGDIVDSKAQKVMRRVNVWTGVGVLFVLLFGGIWMRRNRGGSAAEVENSDE